MYKKLTPILNTSTQYIIKFYNKINNPHTGHGSVLSSTGFYISGSTSQNFIDDDGAGGVRRYTIESNNKVYANALVGTIDYLNGIIILNDLNITSVSNTDGTINLTCIPDSNDILPVRNQLLEIDISGSLVLSTSDNSGQGASVSSYSVVGSGTSSTTTTSSSSSSSSGSSSSGSYS
jgi:hypothetical protein